MDAGLMRKVVLVSDTTIEQLGQRSDARVCQTRKS